MATSYNQSGGQARYISVRGEDGPKNERLWLMPDGTLWTAAPSQGGHQMDPKTDPLLWKYDRQEDSYKPRFGDPEDSSASSNPLDALTKSRDSTWAPDQYSTAGDALIRQKYGLGPNDQLPSYDDVEDPAAWGDIINQVSQLAPRDSGAPWEKYLVPALASGLVGGALSGALAAPGTEGLGAAAGWTSGYDIPGAMNNFFGSSSGSLADIGNMFAENAGDTATDATLTDAAPQWPGNDPYFEHISKAIGNGMDPWQATQSTLFPNGTGLPAPGLSSFANNASTVSKIFNGSANSDDYIKALGTLGSTALGYVGSEAQSSAATDTADKYLALGQPYREKLSASYAPGFSMSNEPGYQEALDNTMQSYLRKASTGGNPFENPGVSTEALKYVTAGTALPQLNTYRSQLGGFGQLGINTAGTADLAAASNAGGGYDALGYGLSQLTQPQNNTLDDLLKQYFNGGGYKPNSGGVV